MLVPAEPDLRVIAAGCHALSVDRHLLILRDVAAAGGPTPTSEVALRLGVMSSAVSRQLNALAGVGLLDCARWKGSRWKGSHVKHWSVRHDRLEELLATVGRFAYRLRPNRDTGPVLPFTEGQAA